MNKENLQKHVDYCREVLKGTTSSPATFDMQNFYDDESCETSACFLGWTVFSFPYYMEDRREIHESCSWGETSDDLFWIKYASDYWKFLFSSDWSNDLEQAVLRAEYLIEHNKPPENWDYELRL